MDTSAADIFVCALHGDAPPPQPQPAPDAQRSTTATATTSSSAIGGFLVCLDVPQATELGVDYEVFRTGPKFQGVKFVPLGIHFVVFRSREQEHGIRQGFFVRVTHHAQVLVREWSAEKEELGPPRPGLNIEHLERAVLAFQLDSGLGAYPKQHHKVWTRMTKYISDSVLQRCGVELGALLLPGDSDPLSEPAPASVTPFFPDLPRTVRFTPLQPKRKALSAAERTQYHFDRSALLEELLASDFASRWEELVGEFQLAFVVFLQLSSLAALEQWKQFIVLLSSCDRALATHEPLFAAFLKLLRVHLEQIPEDFFQDETTSENFLRPCLVSLMELLDDSDAPSPLRRLAQELQRACSLRFGLDLSALDVDEEFAPVVVPEAELLAALHIDERASRAAATTATATAADDEQANAAIAAAFLATHQRSM